MSDMALAYVPPGVSVQELSSPAISPLLAVPASVCLVGVTQGYQVGTATIVFDNTGATQTLTVPAGSVFQKVSVSQTFVSVKNALDPTKGSGANGAGYLETTDYTAAVAGDGHTVTITPVSATDLATNGGTLLFVYRYVDSNYFVPTKLDSQSAVEDRYGPSYNNDGTAISSTVSYASGVAFENGASEVIVQPLFKLTTPSDPNSIRLQPSSSEAASNLTWQQTLFGLRDYQDINIVVPVVGQSAPSVTDSIELAIFQSVQDHIHYMRTQNQYIIGIFGEDGTSAAILPSLLRTHASTLEARYAGDVNEQLVLLSPTNFTRFTPSSAASQLNIGGQYVAAGVAGMLAARPVFSPLTRKQIAGIVAVKDGRNQGDKNADAAAGLLVVEQRGTIVQVRHAITLDNTATQKRELSVVRSKHRLIESIQDTLESQVIGQVPADGNAPLVVRSVVGSVLEQLRGENNIIDYSNLQARTLTLDPTTVEVRFSYRPAFPLNYINVIFSIDLSSGDLTATTATTTVG